MGGGNEGRAEGGGRGKVRLNGNYRNCNNRQAFKEGRSLGTNFHLMK